MSVEQIDGSGGMRRVDGRETSGEATTDGDIRLRRSRGTSPRGGKNETPVLSQDRRPCQFRNLRPRIPTESKCTPFRSRWYQQGMETPHLPRGCSDRSAKALRDCAPPRGPSRGPRCLRSGAPGARQRPYPAKNAPTRCTLSRGAAAGQIFQSVDHVTVPRVE